MTPVTTACPGAEKWKCAKKKKKKKDTPSSTRDPEYRSNVA